MLVYGSSGGNSKAYPAKGSTLDGSYVVMRSDIMRAYMLIVAALVLISSAGAVPEVVSQGITQVASGSDEANQVGINGAIASGDGALVGQSVAQTGVADEVLQVGANVALVPDADDAAVGQTLSQGAQGNDAAQIGGNIAYIEGDNAVLGQSATQSAAAEGDTLQIGINGALVDGDDAAMAQYVSQGTQGENTLQGAGNIAWATGESAVMSQYVAQAAANDEEVLQIGANLAIAPDTGDGAYVGQYVSSAATGDIVNQVLVNLAYIGGDDSAVSQYNAGGIIADSYANQYQFNVALYENDESEGGALAQSGLSSAVADDVDQIALNLGFPVNFQ
jgi:hypothetical protein